MGKPPWRFRWVELPTRSCRPASYQEAKRALNGKPDSFMVRGSSQPFGLSSCVQGTRGARVARLLRLHPATRTAPSSARSCVDSRGRVSPAPSDLWFIRSSRTQRFPGARVGSPCTPEVSAALAVSRTPLEGVCLVAQGKFLSIRAWAKEGSRERFGAIQFSPCIVSRKPPD